MIQIVQHDEKWRLKLDETWEFKDFDEMKENLMLLSEMKRKFGSLNRKEKIVMGYGSEKDGE